MSASTIYGEKLVYTSADGSMKTIQIGDNNIAQIMYLTDVKLIKVDYAKADGEKTDKPSVYIQTDTFEIQTLNQK